MENVGREAQAASVAAATARTDRAMVARLTGIRTSSEPADRPAAYATAFESYGLDAERIRKSAIRDELIGALDDWRGAPPILEGVDRDVWRTEVRAIARNDRALLEARAEADVVQDLPLLSLLLLGDRLGHAGHIESAIRVYRTARGRFPDSFWGCAGLARWCSRSGDRRSAYSSVEHLTAALVLRQGALALRDELAKTLLRQGDLERALAETQKLHDLSPEFPGARSRLAKLYRRKGDGFYSSRNYRSAGRALARSLELEKSNAHYLRRLSHCLWETGGRRKAIEALRKSIRSDEAKSWYGHVQLGRYLSETERNQTEAIATLRLAKTLTGNNIKSQHFTHRCLAEALERHGDMAGAIEAHRTVIQLLSSASDTWSFRSSYTAIARMLEKQDGTATAVSFLKAAVDKHKTDYWLYMDLGYFLLRADREPEAEVALTEVRVLQKQRAEQYPEKGFYLLTSAYFLAHCPLKRLREPAEALKLVSQGVALRNAYYALHDRVWFLGPVLYRSGKYEEALAALSGTGNHGEQAHCHLFFALSNKALGNDREAQAAWDRALVAPGRNVVETYVWEEAREIMEASR